MTNPQVQNDPVITLPVLNINGLLVSRDGTTPTTKLNISAGTARDSNNVMDITVGTANPNLEGSTIASPLVINTAVVGANGIDAGTLGASHVYAVYVIADSRYYNSVAGLLSLASNATPTMPFGYDSYRLIGYAVTGGGSTFLAMYTSGNGNARRFTYDAPIQILSGNQTSYTGVDLTNFVAPVANTPCSIFSNFTANAAADVENLQGYNSTGDAVTIIAPVAGATAHTTSQNPVLAQLNTAAPSIKYKVSAGSLVLDLVSFDFFV